MKKLITVLTTIFICFSLTEICAQNEVGYVNIQIQNAKKPLCKIDDSIAFNFNNALLKLTPGKHEIKIWMPFTTLIDSSIYVKANDTSKYVFKVKYTKEYSKYLNDYSKYRQVKKQRWFISPVLIGASVGTALFAHNKATGYVNKALQNKEEYYHAGSQSTMDGYEADFNENKKKYRQFAAMEIGMYSVAGILTANYIRLLIKQHHTVPPTYKEEKLLSRIKVNTYPDLATKKLLVGLSMNF
ncbi:MAG: hypothetical protein A3F72_15940 [Bacteroidetes bacterium RIFCSPLOWO2_12_FULL_35_15]|nr:MAG: hypothetical protein A3F72_15940 [Bacteroidetes bacterium RIFCSPLOWO2_12_FULL_35_15]